MRFGEHACNLRLLCYTLKSKQMIALIRHLSSAQDPRVPSSGQAREEGSQRFTVTGQDKPTAFVELATLLLTGRLTFQPFQS